jgi:Recombinase
MAKCFECENAASHEHHVVPQSLGGTKTVPLCSGCHPKAHWVNGAWPISELTKRGLSKRKSAGLATGGTIPFGYDKTPDGRLVRNESESHIIEEMLALRASGKTLRWIASWLKDKQVSTKTGRTQWQPKVVDRVIRGAIVPAWHPQVVKEILDREGAN